MLALVGAARFAGKIRVGDLELDRRSSGDGSQAARLRVRGAGGPALLAHGAGGSRFGPRQRGLPNAEELAKSALIRVGLVGLEDRSPQSLSLGEQRRLAIAAVLSLEPALLLLDEPTASLDSRSRRSVLDAIRASGATTLFATHDLEAAIELDADVLVLSEGRLLGGGKARVTLADAALLDAAGLDVPGCLI